MSGSKPISQRQARQYRRTLAFLKQAVENEKRTWPYSLNVRQALSDAVAALGKKP